MALTNSSYSEFNLGDNLEATSINPEVELDFLQGERPRRGSKKPRRGSKKPQDNQDYLSFDSSVGPMRSAASASAAGSELMGPVQEEQIPFFEFAPPPQPGAGVLLPEGKSKDTPTSVASQIDKMGLTLTPKDRDQFFGKDGALSPFDNAGNALSRKDYRKKLISELVDAEGSPTDTALQILASSPSYNRGLDRRVKALAQRESNVPGLFLKRQEALNAARRELAGVEQQISSKTNLSSNLIRRSQLRNLIAQTEMKLGSNVLGRYNKREALKLAARLKMGASDAPLTEEFMGPQQVASRLPEPEAKPEPTPTDFIEKAKAEDVASQLTSPASSLFVSSPDPKVEQQIFGDMPTELPERVGEPTTFLEDVGDAFDDLGAQIVNMFMGLDPDMRTRVGE